jgi:hypothetical protein
MKYYKIIIAFIVIGALILLIYSMFDINCYNFKIIDVSIRKINFYDPSNLKKNKNYYEIKLIPEYCNCKKVFMGGKIEAGMDGIIENVEKITVFDSLRHDITPSIKGWDYSERFNMTGKDSTRSHEFYTHLNLQEMVNLINNRDRNGVGFRVKTPRLFYIESDSPLPKKIKINFSTYSIEKNVEESKIMIIYKINSKGFYNVFLNHKK